MSRRALRTPQHSETRLTPRQTQVLDRVIRGLENKQIARELGVSEQAVKEQVSGLLQRLNVPNRAALAEAGTAQRITGTHAVEPAWLRYLFSQAPVMIAWTGIRGAVSLAAALALPQSVPGRDLIVFVTFCVILATLVGQGLTLPAVVRALHIEDDGGAEREDAKARIKAAEAALARLEELEQEGWVRDDTAERVRGNRPGDRASSRLRGHIAKVVKLTERYAVMAEDVVGGRDVEIEVRECKAG